MPGLPQAQLKRKAELKAQQPPELQTPERVMIPIDVPGGQQPPANEGGDPANLPPENVEVQPNEEKPLSLEDQWRIKSEQWETKFRSLQGVVENLEPQLRSEREMRNKLEKELQELREAMPRPQPQPDPTIEFTEEEAKVYGDSAPVIEKVARKVARGEFSSALADLRKEIAALKEANSRVESGVASSEEQRFIQTVKQNVKNFDAIIKTSEWQDYLQRRVPYSKITIGQALQSAHDDRDLESIVEIFQGFKPTKAALELMKSPNLGAGELPSHASKQKPMLKWSDRQKISEDFRKGRITKEVRDQWDKAFKEAEAENRIDYKA